MPVDTQKNNALLITRKAVDMLASLTDEEFANITSSKEENLVVKDKLSKIVEEIGELDIPLSDINSTLEFGKIMIEIPLRTILTKVISQFNMTVSDLYGKDIDILTTKDINLKVSEIQSKVKVEKTPVEETTCEETPVTE